LPPFFLQVLFYTVDQVAQDLDIELPLPAPDANISPSPVSHHALITL
jgi:hypothetical protein